MKSFGNPRAVRVGVALRASPILAAAVAWAMCNLACAEAGPDAAAAGRKAFMAAAAELSKAQADLKASDARRDAAIAAFDAGVAAGASNLIPLAEAAQKMTEAAETDERAVRAARLHLARSRKDLVAVLLESRAEPGQPAKPSTALELIGAAAKTQEKVDKLETTSTSAFSITDKASAIALAMAEKRLKTASAGGDAARELAALADASAGREAAMDAYDERGGAQQLGNLLVASASQLAECQLKGATADCTKFESETRELQARLDRRAKDSDSAMALAKLASFKVQSAEVARSPEEQVAALEFLQLIDRNPKAGWKFGGEGATVTAGPDGGDAVVRISLQRFVKSWARDTTVTLSAPLAKDGDTRLLASNGKYRPKETSLRLEMAGLRSLKRDENKFTRFNQFGVFGEVSRQRFGMGDVADPGASPKISSRTAVAFGVSSLYAMTDKRAVHRVGFSVGHAYDAGSPSIRCNTAPGKMADPATGAPTAADETFLKCSNALFGPLDGSWSRTLEYRYRQELENFALAPAFSYETVTRTKTYELPVYLIHGEGDNKGKFTAGVAYRQVSTPDKPIDKRWELFVSSPLSLLGP